MNDHEKILVLEKKISSLENQLKSLTSSNSIPLSLEQALSGRGFVDTFDLDLPSVAPIAGMGFVQEIGLTGNIQTITVPEFPPTYLQIKNKPGHYIPVFIS